MWSDDFCESVNALTSVTTTASSVVIQHPEVESIGRRNLARVAVGTLPVIFSVCCAFYVAYGRLDSR